MWLFRQLQAEEREPMLNHVFWVSDFVHFLVHFGLVYNWAVNLSAWGLKVDQRRSVLTSGSHGASWIQ